MLDPHKPYLPLRALAIMPIVLFIPSLVSFAIAKPGVVWPEYSGVLFHLAILFLIARLDAPAWSKAAGYGWITLDVLTGITSINGVPYDITWPIRLGGHVLAGTWILSSSLCARPVAVRVVGAITGIWLGSFSFVAHVLPAPVLYPAALLIIVWFALIAILVRDRSTAPS